MPTFEGLRLKILKYWRVGLADFRKKQLNSHDFTIISNNCWGGMVYESYNLPKESPTVGLFFIASDYIEFLSDLEGYLNGELRFINPFESRWKDMPEVSGNKKFGSYPVGVLSNGKNDIEIFFLHYHSEQEAKDKWSRRISRIHWDKLLVKFNDQNGCTEDEILKFIHMDYKNKLFFTSKHWANVPDDQQIVIRQFPRREFIMASYEPFGKSRYLNVTDVINSL